MASNYPKFSVPDLICWKFLPSKLGCGRDYIWSFKYAWIAHNKKDIKNAAANQKIPPLLLAGVALREVGGDDFTDWPAFRIRSLLWSGPSWTDAYMATIASYVPQLKPPAETSMGAVSIQLRRAATAVGLDASTLTQEQLNTLAEALQSDVNNLNIVARHLHELLLIDYPTLIKTDELTDEQIRVVGTRYWRGPEASSAFIKKKAVDSSSYGSRILEHKQSLLEALQ